MSRTNTLVPISFGRDETQLLELLDKGRKKKCMSRSGWVSKKSERSSEVKNYKPYKKNERNRKTKQGRRSNDVSTSYQDESSAREGTRIGGSTTNLLSEPGAGKVQGINLSYTSSDRGSDDTTDGKIQSDAPATSTCPLSGRSQATTTTEYPDETQSSVCRNRTR